MGTVLNFEMPPLKGGFDIADESIDHPEAATWSGCAEIIIFPGVRRERHCEDASNKDDACEDTPLDSASMKVLDERPSRS